MPGPETAGQFFTVQVFITNGGRQPLPLPVKGGLRQGAAVEVTQRNVHQLGKPAKQRRNELAKRHQMVLVVAPGLCLTRLEARPPNWCSPRLAAQRHANQCRLLTAGKTLLQGLPVVWWQLLGQQRQGRFRRDDQRAVTALELLAIPLQGLGTPVPGSNFSFWGILPCNRVTSSAPAEPPCGAGSHGGNSSSASSTRTALTASAPGPAGAASRTQRRQPASRRSAQLTRTAPTQGSSPPAAPPRAHSQSHPSQTRSTTCRAPIRPAATRLQKQ